MKVEGLLHDRIKQDSTGSLPLAPVAKGAQRVLQVSQKLIEMGAHDLIVTLPSFQSVLVKFAVEDDASVRPIDGDIGQQGRKMRFRNGVEPVAVPGDLVASDTTVGKVLVVEISHKGFEKMTEADLVIENSAEEEII